MIIRFNAWYFLLIARILSKALQLELPSFAVYAEEEKEMMLEYSLSELQEVAKLMVEHCSAVASADMVFVVEMVVVFAEE